MSHRTIPVACLAFALALAASLAARAAIIFNNFGADDAFGNSGLLLQGEAVGTIADVDQAAQFTVGDTDYDLTSVSLGINLTDPPNAGTGVLDVQLAANSGGLPGAILGTVSLNVNTTGKQIVTASFGGAPTLDANSSYWVIANARTTFDGGWYFNTIGDTGPTAGRSNNGPWSLHGNDSTRFAFRVEGRTVPEPSPAAAIAVAMLGLATMSRPRGDGARCGAPALAAADPRR